MGDLDNESQWSTGQSKKNLQQCTTQKLAVKDAESVSQRQTLHSELEDAIKTWPSDRVELQVPDTLD